MRGGVTRGGSIRGGALLSSAARGVASLRGAVAGGAVRGGKMPGRSIRTGATRSRVAVPVLTGLALGLGLASCGGAPPAPREYPRLEDESVEPTPVTIAREPLRDAPLVVAQPSSDPVVTFRVAFEAGSASDPAGYEGVTRLAAELMAGGGAGALSYAELSRALYPMAGRISAHVERDMTVFVGQVHRDHADAFYALFRDVLLQPRMSEEDFGRVRDQQRDALVVSLRSADDEELGKQALQTLMYEGHPYAHPALGTEAALARVRVDDVRAQRARVFCAGRSIVGIAGDYPAPLAERLRSDISQLTSAQCVGRRVLPAPPDVERRRVLIVRKPEAQSVAVSMGFPIDVQRDDPDYPALVLVAAWLGQHRQFIGRLMQQIRGERGLNYGDYAYAEHFTQEGWSTFPLPNVARRQQHFSIWLRPLRPETAHFAIRLAIRELTQLVEGGMDQEELDRVRAFADRYYALFLQTSSRRLGFAMDDAYYGVDAAYLERLRESWRALTPETLNAAMRRHLTPDRLQIACVASDAEQLAQALATDAESPITYRSEVSAAVLAEDRDIVAYPLQIPRDRIRIQPVDTLF